MAINSRLPQLDEARLNAPDLDEEGQVDVESYPLPSGDEIEDPYLAEILDEARQVLSSGLEDEEKVENKKAKQTIRKASGDAILDAMNRIGQGGNKFTSLAVLGRAVGGSPESLHQAILQLWRERKITPSPAEGRFGSTEEEQRWWLQAQGETFGYVELRR